LVDNKSGSGPPGAVPSRGKWVRLQYVPPPVNDLLVDFIGPNSMQLTWTAPGDNCHGGQAAHYDLRHALYPLTELNFNSGDPSTTTNPRPPGQGERQSVGGLSQCLHWYFAIKSTVEPNTWSAIS